MALFMNMQIWNDGLKVCMCTVHVKQKFKSSQRVREQDLELWSVNTWTLLHVTVHEQKDDNLIIGASTDS